MVKSCRDEPPDQDQPLPVLLPRDLERRLLFKFVTRRVVV